MKRKTFAFTLKCGNCDFIIPKDDVKFVNGYGIVTARFDSKEESFWLIGVVDKNYRQVLPLTNCNLVPRLFVAPNGNFLFVAYNSEVDEYQVMHFDVDGNTINLAANDFLELDDEVIQLYYDEYSTLYDTQSGEFLTPFYSYIGPFVYSEKFDCKVARATYYIEDEDGKTINEVSTIINTRGEVLENYYDLAGDIIIASKDLADVLSLGRKKDD